MTQPADEISIVLVYSPAARAVRELVLSVPRGTTLAQAVALWQLADASSEFAMQVASGHFGIWGKAAQPNRCLKANDRIELYRALTVDPKTARRKRFVRQGSKGAGLFATQRAGGKAGY